MLWWFERSGRRTTIEVLDLGKGEYELRVTDADGHDHVERFANVADLANRQQAIEDQLIATGWTRSGEWLL